MIVPLRFYLTGPDRDGREAVARILADRFGFAWLSVGEALGWPPGETGAHMGSRLAPWRTVVAEVRCGDEALVLRRAGYRGIRVEPAHAGRPQVHAARLRRDPPALPVDWVLRHAPGAQGQPVRLLFARATLDAVERSCRHPARIPSPHAG